MYPDSASPIRQVKNTTKDYELLCSNLCEVRDKMMSSLSVFVSPPYIMSLQCQGYHASQLWRPTIGSTLAKRHITCLYTLRGPMCIHRESFRCAHTLWCDMNPQQRFYMIRLQTCRTGWARAALLNINLLSFWSYHFSCMCVMFGRMLAMLRMSPGEAGRGRNVEHTSSQDPTRCWRCSPIEHEILSAGRWFIILVLLLGENSEGETARGRMCKTNWMVSRLWLFLTLLLW